MSTSLSDLFHLLQSQKYHKGWRREVENRLRRSQIVHTIRCRLIHNGQASRSMLAECSQSGNKARFCSVYHTFLSLRQGSGDDGGDSYAGLSTPSSESPSVTSLPFLHCISSRSRASSAYFVTRIRNDPDYLVDRFQSLSDQQLLSLLSSHRGTTTHSSIFGSRPSSLRSKASVPSNEAHRAVLSDGLFDLTRHDALSLLFHLVEMQANPELWARVTANAFRDRSPARERLILAISNETARAARWSGRHTFEAWSQTTSHQGQFLSDKPDKHSFRSRSQVRDPQDAENEASAEAFFSKSIKDLSELSSCQSTTGVIPDQVMIFGRSVTSILRDSPKDCQDAAQFIATRWLFHNFLMEAIVNPESYGLLPSQYISEDARRRILKEVATRAQHVTLDAAYNWRGHSSAIDSDVHSSVENIVASFKAGHADSDIETPNARPPNKQRRAFGVQTPSDTVLLCPTDILTLVNALHPQPTPFSSGPSSIFSAARPQSSSSSSSGLCLSSSVWSFGSGTVDLPSDVPQGSPAEHTLMGDLRKACAELKTRVGTEPSNPLAEQWAPFKTISSRARSSQDEDPSSSATCEPVSQSFGAPSVFPESQDSADGYSKLRSSVFRISQDLGPNLRDGETPSNRSSPSYDASTGEYTSRNPYCNANTAAFPAHGPRNPFHRTAEAQALPSDSFEWSCQVLESGSDTTLSGGFDNSPEGSKSLATFSSEAATHYKREGDIVRSHHCSQTSQRIRNLSSTSLTKEGCAPLVQQFASDVQCSIERAVAASRNAERAIRGFATKLESQEKNLGAMDEAVNTLRVKMWYAADVRAAARYEELKGVASALRVMWLSSQPDSKKSLPTLRRRNAPRSTSLGPHVKAEAAASDLMAANSSHCGHNKLANEQVLAVSSWIKKGGIENLCRGEERLHRLCLEICKCAELLVSNNKLQSPELWASELFQSQKLGAMQSSQPGISRSMFSTGISHSGSNYTTLGRPVSCSSDINDPYAQQDYQPSTLHHRTPSIHVARSRNASTGADYFGTQSPTLTDRSSATFWSPACTDAQVPSSATSVTSRSTSPISNPLKPGQIASSGRTGLSTRIKEGSISLLLSEFGNFSFPGGSETDQAMWTTLGGRFANAISRDSCLSSLASNPGLDDFDYINACHTSMSKFYMSPDPFAKLQASHDLQSILFSHSRFSEAAQAEGSVCCNTNGITERSDQTVNERPSRLKLDTSESRAADSGHDIGVKIFQTVFRDPQFRAKTLFRDSQYVASLVSPEVLDTTPQGKTFWNAFVAAQGIKQEICKSMVEMADSIVSHHTSSRGHSQTSSAAQQQRDAETLPPPSPRPDEDISAYSMADAALLSQITAKEGDTAAQRESATSYSTHPELMGRIIAPLTKPGDVFRESASAEGMGKWKKEQDAGRYDPSTMCVAHHWMELSAKGGDALAVKYSRQFDEMERDP